MTKPTPSACAATARAPTWTPQRAQEKWSGHSARANFINAWGVSSPCSLSGRVMPKSYVWYEQPCDEEIQRASLVGRRILPRTVNLDLCRIELGPSRRDPQGTLQQFEQFAHTLSGDTKNALQSASAMGSFAVTRRVSRRVSERQPLLLNERSTSFDFGANVATRTAHANRACVQSASIVDAACTHASNHPTPGHREGSSRGCSLQNGLSVARSSHDARVSSTAHGVHG